jgi:cytochrome c oxidase subunit 2
MFGALLLFIVSPFISGWWLPKNVATFGPSIDNLFYLILAITGFFFVLTEGLMVYAMYRFAGKPGQRGAYVHGNHRLELIWTLVPGVILLLIAIVQIRTWAEVKFQKNMPAPNGQTQQMEVTARQWEWRVRYPSAERMESWVKDPKLANDFGPNPHLDDIHLTNEIHVWKDAKVLVHLRTQDVIHSFFLPNLRLKQDALPGKVIPVWFAAMESNTARTSDGRWLEVGYDPATGKIQDASKLWELTCAEFCGVRHSFMRGRLFVHESREDFLAWLRQTQEEQNRHQAPASGPVAAAR